MHKQYTRIKTHNNNYNKKYKNIFSTIGTYINEWFININVTLNTKYNRITNDNILNKNNTILNININSVNANDNNNNKLIQSSS